MATPPTPASQTQSRIFTAAFCIVAASGLVTAAVMGVDKEIIVAIGTVLIGLAGALKSMIPQESDKP